MTKFIRNGEELLINFSTLNSFGDYNFFLATIKGIIESILRIIKL